MKQRALLALTTAFLLTAGCLSTAPHASTAEATPDSVRASIYVDGDERGVTPATLRINRRFDATYSFGVTIVTLRQGRDVVRTFQVEHLYTSKGSELRYRASEPSLSPRTYRVSELPMQDSTHVVPYFRGPVLVEDPGYRFELLIEN